MIARSTWMALSLAAAFSLSSIGVARAQVPVRSLAQSLAIESDTFTLPNGLRVVVHSDRSEARVAVVVYYAVGGGDEPPGRTGFAHLFEHLLFNGSENAPDFYPNYMAEMGAPFNGTTTADHTVYYEVVPTTGLERALFLESDRMGHFLGTVTQGVLDKERNIVMREKAEGAGRPLATLERRLTAALYPPDHPYGHELLGSDADLRAASLTDVRDWFNTHYGPTNATLALAGDIDIETARRLVGRYFGDLEGGVPPEQSAPPIPTLAHRLDEAFHDAVPAAEIHRYWTVPGAGDTRSIPLLAAARAMSVEGAPLKEILVDREKLFTDIGAAVREQEKSSIFFVTGTVATGVDPGHASARLDAVLAEVLRAGPSPDDLDRASVRSLAAQLSMNDAVLGRALTLGRGLMNGNPNQAADRAVSVSEQSVDAAAFSARTWLSRPPYAVTILPYGPGDGPATPDAPQAEDGPGSVASALSETSPVVREGSTRTQRIPPIGAATAIPTPTIKRATLSNGMRIVLVARPNVSMTHVRLVFDAGKIADPTDQIGISDLMASVLDQGTEDLDARALREAVSALGAQVSVANNADDTSISMTVPGVNAQFGIGLLADIVRTPRFDPSDVDRASKAMIAQVIQAIADHPSSRVIEGLAGPGSIYASIGTADPQALQRMDRADLQRFHHAWFRPEQATLYVSTALSMPMVVELATRSFADWRAPGQPAVRPAGAKTAARAGVYVIDRPDHPGVTIEGLALTGIDPSADNAPLLLAGHAFDSANGRLDRNLRQQRQWSYAVGGALEERVDGVYHIVGGAVAPENAGAALGEFVKEARAFTTTMPITDEELAAARETLSRGLLGQAAPGMSMLGQVAANDARRRPDDFLKRLGDRLRSASLEDVRTVARRGLDPDTMVWIVTGDASSIGEQLEDQAIAFTRLEIPNP